MRVLIVEDYAPIRVNVAQGLREEGFAVDAAANGQDGLWFAQSQNYDVIILDLMLPKVDGRSILRQLRATGRKACVLILTARNEIDDRVNCLNAGADDYLVKPFAFAELLARVRTLVRRKYDQVVPLIHIGDLEIESAARVVRRGGRVIELTSREYMLLEYLAVREGQLVTRSEIWEHVYDFHAEGSSNVVDVYVGYLRKKLEAEGESRLIHTRRGQGYWIGEQK